jgi:CRP/FNR family cyclic AMP-dependent transcriptional regulator
VTVDAFCSKTKFLRFWQLSTMDRQEASAFIRQNGWLATTPDDFKEQILARCSLLAVSAGSTIFRAADDTGSIFAVVEGQFELHLALQGQDPTLAHICGPGSWLGNTAAMTGRRRRITAIAGAHGCHTLQLSTAEIGRIADRNPRAWRYFAELHARNYLTALDVIDALKRSDPRDRLVATLCNLLDGLTKGNKFLHVSQSDIAALTRLGRSKVNAVLNDLERQDLVRRKYGAVEIPNVAALRRLNSANGRA